MTLEYRDYGDKLKPILTACPIEDCEIEFADYSGAKRREHYLQDHTPEDFGLD